MLKRILTVVLVILLLMAGLLLWNRIFQQENHRRLSTTMNMQTAEKGEPSERIERLVVESLGKGDQEPTLAAQYELGLAFEKGKGVPQNDSEAMSLYQKSARGGYAPAQYRLARIYSEGSLVSRNDILAYAWLQLAATKEIGAHPPVNPQKIKSLLHLLRSRMSPAEISQALRNEKLFSGKS